MVDLEDEVGDIISKARIGLGYTIDHLAGLTGISGRQIEKIEQLQFQPDEEQVHTLAKALSLNPDKLLALAQNKWQPPSDALPQSSVIVESIFVPYGAYGENCYIVACPETFKAAVVDPGGAIDQILERLADSNLQLDMVLITHAHGDHTGGLIELESTFPNLRIAANALEWKSIPRPRPLPLESADDGMEIVLGTLTIAALHTPGHTPGSTCYSVNGACFVGDTLFAGSIGRPSGTEVYQRMLTDIRAKVLSLPYDTILYTGHGPVTTVKQELKYNPFF